MARQKFQGLLFFGVLICLCVPGFAKAAEAVRALPMTFDSRERITKPDLSGLTRLRFLTTVDFPPFNFIDQDGRLAGFHIDLAREICRVLAIEARCQVQALTFDELLPALGEGQGEAVLSGVKVTPALRRGYGFSRPFMMLPARFTGNRTRMGETLTVAALQGKPVGVVAGTVHEAMAKAFFPTLDRRPFPDRAALMAALKDGSVAAVFGDGVQLGFWTASAEAGGCCAMLPGAYLSEDFLGEGLTVALRKDDAVLKQAIDHALLELSRSGRLNELALRYFPMGLY
ncbi:amino acid ABC transporter [Rhizobium rhizosphaerae]|uniref:Amino acid ABC transporter n=1 Tax=Xaviernesmea rhizosphaerae TaxID=1672749 RepID=A0ABX3PCZ9_9HYPH|nr:amino acid ABC transporter [Xaviernesmea rhizosphaerae]